MVVVTSLRVGKGDIEKMVILRKKTTNKTPVKVPLEPVVKSTTVTFKTPFYLLDDEEQNTSLDSRTINLYTLSSSLIK